MPPMARDSRTPLMYIFSPLSTHSSPSFTALVRQAPKISEPPPGSVVAMPRKAWPAVTLGRTSALSSGVP